MEFEETNNNLLRVLKELYPQLSEDELQEAKRNLTKQMQIVDRIFNRLQNSPDLQRKYDQLKREYHSPTSLDVDRKSGSLNAPRNEAA